MSRYASSESHVTRLKYVQERRVGHARVVTTTVVDIALLPFTL